MALTQILKGQSREVKTTGYLRQLKRNEWVPAVVYGKGQANLTLQLPRKDLTKILTHIGTRGIFSLEIQEQSQPIMAQIKEIQKDRISGEIIHVDFLTVKMNEKIHSMIRIQLMGEEAIIAKGGVLQHNAREIPVSCLPGDLPEVVSLDISELEIGSKITVSDLPIPAAVEVLEDADTVIAVIMSPAREEAVVEVVEKEPAEPVV